MDKPLIEDYVKDVKRTAPTNMSNDEFLAWAGYGLCEAGEVQNEIKKYLYQGSEYNRDKLIDELGDLCFYIAAVMINRGITLQEVLAYNIEKRKNFVPGKGREVEKW